MVPPAATLGAQIGWLLRRARVALIVLAALFALLVALEGAELLQLTYGIHPALGVVAALAFLGGLVWLGLPLWRAMRLPQVVCPPAIPAGAAFEPRHLREQARYLDRYLLNCRRNPELSAQVADVDAALAELAILRPRWDAIEPLALAAARAELHGWIERRLLPLLAPLDEKAERLIHQEALSVGLGTAISPYGTLDAFVVLWRSIRLTGRLAVLYYGRPGPRGALRILADVALATAAAPYLQSVGDSLGGLVARSVGGIAGVVAGPATQGITNALVLVRLGYVVQGRCRSFEGWDPSVQRSALGAAVRATQRVAVGLTTEILRQAGSGLVVVANVAATSVTQAAGGIVTAASAAFGFARTFGQKLSKGLRELGDDPLDATPQDGAPD